jgi:tripartite-type tricarboxylate transporter receptor subunit TctC
MNMMKGNKTLLFVVLFMACTLVCSTGVFAAPDKYPTRAINVIVPFTAGGSTDTSARAMATFLTKKWGVPVNVVNKPGGNTIPGTLEMYSANPDGYTMLADGLPMSSLLDVVVKDLPFKVKDRTFIAMTVMNPIITIVPASSPFKTFADLVAFAKKEPENLTWDSLGGVSGDDFSGRMVFNAIGVDPSKAKVVMSKGGSEAATRVAGGHILMGHPAVISAWPHIQAGTVRVLAIALDKRDPLLPDVPTHAELGYPSVNCPFWLGVSGPPKLPDHIVQIWSDTIKEMMKDPEYLDQIKKMFFYPYYHGPKEMAEYIAKESAIARKVYGIEK